MASSSFNQPLTQQEQVLSGALSLYACHIWSNSNYENDAV
jgi:hypothetical protein